jgi:hypothetical protein
VRNEIPYLRLPGSAGLIFRKSLWLGPDHVLSVSSNVSTHEYRRLFFSEIQALVVTEVESSTRYYGLVFAAIAGAFAIALGVKDYNQQFPVDMQLFWTVVCALACLGLTVFAVTRPRVRCSIKTRAGTQFLPSLKSMERVQRVAAILKTEIDKAQGTLGGELLMYPPIEAATIPPGFRPYKGWMHYAAFAGMLVSALLTFLHPTETQSFLYTNFVGGLRMTMVVLTCGAAVNQRGSNISQMARMSIVLAMAWTALSFIATVVIVATSMQAALQGRIAAEFWRDPIQGIANANAIAYGVFGLVGIIAMFAWKPRVRATQGA